MGHGSFARSGSIGTEPSSLACSNDAHLPEYRRHVPHVWTLGTRVRNILLSHAAWVSPRLLPLTIDVFGEDGHHRPEIPSGNSAEIDEITSNRIQVLIRAAEAESARTCQFCGVTGRRRKTCDREQVVLSMLPDRNETHRDTVLIPMAARDRSVGGLVSPVETTA